MSALRAVLSLELAAWSQPAGFLEISLSSAHTRFSPGSRRGEKFELAPNRIRAVVAAAGPGRFGRGRASNSARTLLGCCSKSVRFEFDPRWSRRCRRRVRGFRPRLNLNSKSAAGAPGRRLGLRSCALATFQVASNRLERGPESPRAAFELPGAASTSAGTPLELPATSARTRFASGSSRVQAAIAVANSFLLWQEVL